MKCAVQEACAAFEQSLGMVPVVCISCHLQPAAPGMGRMHAAQQLPGSFSTSNTFCTPVPAAIFPADILAGQGLYFETLTKTYTAKPCNSNSYGVANQTFGLSPSPCR